MTRVDVRGGLKGCRNGGTRNKKGEEDDKTEEEEAGDKEKTKKVRRWSWTNLHFRFCPSWVQCLVPIALVWIVLQEQAQPSLSILHAGGRMLFVFLLWTGFGLCVSIVRFLHQHTRRKQPLFPWETKSKKFAVRGTGQDQQASPIRPHDPSSAAMVHALLDGMVLCLVQEQLSDPSLSQVRSLLRRLEVVSHAFSYSGLFEGQQLQVSDGMVRMRQVCTYLQDRMSALYSLIQVQDQYGTCMADVQQGLQELWDQLEGLHSRVKLQPEKRLEDPHTVLNSTESLYKQLGLFQSKVQECQSYLSTSTRLLQELESRQHILAQTVGLTLEKTWTQDFLQCNTEQFEKVQTHFTSLEQQTLTFVSHLHDLGLSQGESSTFASHVEHKQSSSSSPISSLPVYGIATKSPNLGPDPESPPKINWKLSALWNLCGARRKK